MSGWTHEEAKAHSLIERLYERCTAYAQDFTACPEQGPDLPREDWCERCLAATGLAAVEALAKEWHRWADGRTSQRIDAFRDAAEAIDTALRPDPSEASTDA